ncbi:TetR/AcrR family transcriptional regulator [Actinomadura sp. 9N407]|uniref:TetR/AcrR family transcriptional regulator n=1 Tax=Actinomadura sp. 9N407 TaxID=3375154 RepID=UPI003793A6A7
MTDPVPVWARPERGARGPAPERSRAQITEAAVAIADADGLAAVSMRQVARSLGTGPASLYRYVSGRDDLVDLMADAVAGEIDLAPMPGGDWAGDMVALASAGKAVHLRHPWLLDVPPQPARVGPRAIDYLEHALHLLEPAPADGRTKLEVIGVVNGLVAQFARNEIAARDAAAERQAAQAAYLAQVAAEGRHPRLAAAMADTAPHEDAQILFERTIRRVVTGLIA